MKLWDCRSPGLSSTRSVDDIKCEICLMREEEFEENHAVNVLLGIKPSSPNPATVFFSPNWRPHDMRARCSAHFEVLATKDDYHIVSREEYEIWVILNS